VDKHVEAPVVHPEQKDQCDDLPADRRDREQAVKYRRALHQPVERDQNNDHEDHDECGDQRTHADNISSGLKGSGLPIGSSVLSWATREAIAPSSVPSAVTGLSAWTR